MKAFVCLYVLASFLPLTELQGFDTDMYDLVLHSEQKRTMPTGVPEKVQVGFTIFLPERQSVWNAAEKRDADTYKKSLENYNTVPNKVPSTAPWVCWESSAVAWLMLAVLVWYYKWF